MIVLPPAEDFPFITNPNPSPIQIPPKIAANIVSSVAAFKFKNSFAISIKTDIKIIVIIFLI
jgi:hypothetical protein